MKPARASPRRLIMALSAVLWSAGAAAEAAPQRAPAAHGPAEAAANLAGMTLTLGHRQPYRFELHYQGPTMPFRGPLCYGFAGYNETCMALELRWLTPATTIELWAPGGVPRDLLEGYLMLVRYPAMTDRTYRYRLGDRPTAPGRRDDP